MKQLIVPLAIVAMVALLGAAAAWDCVRLAADARHRVALADQDMQKHELRLVKLLTARENSSPELQSAASTYQAANTATARHEAYEQLVAIIRSKKANGVDATNPLDRKFMDDVAGAINRREIAEQPYDEELAAYQQFLNSFRGGVARMFSVRARTDWKSTR
jgi:hypothetical protein